MVKGQSDKIDDFSLDFRNTQNPFIGNGFIDFWFSGELMYHGEGC